MVPPVRRSQYMRGSGPRAAKGSNMSVPAIDIKPNTTGLPGIGTLLYKSITGSDFFADSVVAL